MSTAREASKPPQLPGFDYVRVLGLGGFADVFLYRQHLPSRLVAVKVLLAAGLSDEVRARFTDEANLMAQLSHHPSIVTVHHASVAADGRPYLVMEYCSQPSLAQRYRSERMSVAEVLRIGVRLVSAVETAHRAGILHRDIKPANVLTTDFGWPALTDFGIAATVGRRGPRAGTGAVGVSVPWAAPEMLADPPLADERSDVYCLAATLYSLLAGRSPFEVAGGANGAAELVGRIERQPVPPVGRSDVPASLQRVLLRAMAKHPDERQASALALGRALQQVETELALPVTTLDLPGEQGTPGPAHVAGAADQETRARPLVVVAPGAAASDGETSAAGPRAGAGSDPDATRPRGPREVRPSGDPAVPVAPLTALTPVTAGADGEDGESRGNGADGTGAAPAPPSVRRVRRGWTSAAAAAVVVAAVGGLVVAFLHGSTPQAPPDGGLEVQRTAPPAVAVPAVSSLIGVRAADGSVRFTWTNPAPQQGDRYQWGLVTATGEEPLALVDTPAVGVPAAQAPGEVCVQVLLVRADGRVSPEAVRGCAG
ncbi:MAG TPA: protein kinase [Cellulomonas sp.]